MGDTAKNSFSNREYKYGFSTEVEADRFPKGLSEEIIHKLSELKKEPQFLLDFRLKSFRHWQKMIEPKWANVNYRPINYQEISYHSSPKTPPNINPTMIKMSNRPKLFSLCINTLVYFF